MQLVFNNKIFEIMKVSKNDLMRWIQMITKGLNPLGDWETSAKVYGNYNVWEIAIIEATKSLAKKYKKRNVEIYRKITNGKKKVIIQFPDEFKDEILEQILPKHITLEELKGKLQKKIRSFVEKKRQQKLLEINYNIAYEMFEHYKDKNDPLKSRFTYWYYYNIGIDVEGK